MNRSRLTFIILSIALILILTIDLFDINNLQKKQFNRKTETTKIASSANIYLSSHVKDKTYTLYEAGLLLEPGQSNSMNFTGTLMVDINDTTKYNQKDYEAFLRKVGNSINQYEKTVTPLAFRLQKININNVKVDHSAPPSNAVDIFVNKYRMGPISIELDNNKE